MERLKSFLRGLVEFFNPRDWIPVITPPPIGPWKPEGQGTMSVWEALFGKEEK